jgi:cytochrome c5
MRALLLACLIACTPPLPVATEADAARAHVELAQLDAGRELLVKKCSSCHDTPTPGQRAPRDWPHQVGEMQQRAGIDATERALIEQFLVVMASK